MKNNKKNRLLILLDIYGFNNFMVNSKKSFLHAKANAAILVNKLLRLSGPPLKKVKIDGDRILFSIEKKGNEFDWAQKIGKIKKQTGIFFAVFKDLLNELALTNTCTCNACSMIQELHLKAAVHYTDSLSQDQKQAVISDTDTAILEKLLYIRAKHPDFIALSGAAFTELGLKDMASYEQLPEEYGTGNSAILVTYPDKKNAKETQNHYRPIKNTFKNAFLKKINCFLIIMGIKKRNYNGISFYSQKNHP